MKKQIRITKPNVLTVDSQGYANASWDPAPKLVVVPAISDQKFPVEKWKSEGFLLLPFCLPWRAVASCEGG